MKRPAAILITLGLALAAGIGVCVHHQLTQTDAAERSVKQVAKATKTLYQKAFIDHPKSNLASAYLNQADYAYQQANKHRRSLSHQQLAVLRTAKQRLKDAKLYVAIHSEAAAILGPEQVITDPKYDSTTLERAYRTLEAADKHYAAAVKSPVTLVSLQAAALAKLRAAQRQRPAAATVAEAEAAIAEVPVAAFKRTYAPIAASLEQAATTETPAAAQSAPSNQTEPPVKHHHHSKHQQVKPAESEPAKPNDQAQGAAAKTPDAEVKAPSTLKPNENHSAATDPASDTTVSEADRSLIGIGGLFDTMHEAETAMKAAQQAAGANRQASAYSIQFGDGSVHYTWSWVTDSPVPEP